jgi:hypothetical protein
MGVLMPLCLSLPAIDQGARFEYHIRGWSRGLLRFLHRSLVRGATRIRCGMRKCRERKRYLSGAEVAFECELVALEGRCGTLRYVIDRPWQVAGLTLEPGIVTYAFYWTDRPYNLYWWRTENGGTVGFYFNLADSVSLSAAEFVWRDLIVDVLVLPDGRVRVIDEDEVPEGLEDGLRIIIEAGKNEVLQNYQDTIQEVKAMLKKYVSRS